MRKKLLALMSLILLVIISGCSDKNAELNRQYEDAMANAKSKIIEEEYDKALGYFNLALEAKSEDVEAQNLIKQLGLLEEVLELEEEKDYSTQIKKLDDIENIETKTNILKDKAKDYKDKIVKSLDEDISLIENNIKENKYEEAQKSLKNIIEKYGNIDVFESQISKCQELIDICTEKQKEAEAKKQKEAEEKKEAAKKNTKKVYCSAGAHYVEEKNYNYNVSACRKCDVKKTIKSIHTYLDCDGCHTPRTTVSAYTGRCDTCGYKVKSGVSKIYPDGRVLYDDGFLEPYNVVR